MSVEITLKMRVFINFNFVTFFLKNVTGQAFRGKEMYIVDKDALFASSQIIFQPKVSISSVLIFCESTEKYLSQYIDPIIVFLQEQLRSFPVRIGIQVRMVCISTCVCMTELFPLSSPKNSEGLTSTLSWIGVSISSNMPYSVFKLIFP